MEDFKTAIIFGQEWMTENLNVNTYRNGDQILYAESPEQWASFNKQKEGCYCYFNFDAENGNKYGKLYNWYAVNDPRGLSPKGFKVSSGADLIKLVENFGGELLAKDKLIAEGGFEAFSSGWCDEFGEMDNQSFTFWSSSINPRNDESAFVLGFYSNNIEFSFDVCGGGYSVRCLRESNVKVEIKNYFNLLGEKFVVSIDHVNHSIITHGVLPLTGSAMFTLDVGLHNVCIQPASSFNLLKRAVVQNFELNILDEFYYVINYKNRLGNRSSYSITQVSEPFIDKETENAKLNKWIKKISTNEAAHKLNDMAHGIGTALGKSTRTLKEIFGNKKG